MTLFLFILCEYIYTFLFKLLTKNYERIKSHKHCRTNVMKKTKIKKPAKCISNISFRSNCIVILSSTRINYTPTYTTLRYIIINSAEYYTVLLIEFYVKHNIM